MEGETNMGKDKESKESFNEVLEEEPLLEIDNDNQIIKKLIEADNLQKERIDKKKVKTKDTDELKVVEAVLDDETRTTLFNLRKRKIIDQMTGIISTGKEANVYHAFSPDGNELAVKIYRTSTNIFKGLQTYIIGDPRFTKIKRDQRSFVYAWAKKEYKNLIRAEKAKVSVPKPIACLKDVVVMEFIGKDSIPYKLLKEVEIEDPQATYKEVIDNIKKLYRKAGLVHADLSEYNMIYTPKIYFIDISQGVLLEHPYAEIFLYRDIKNITQFFYTWDVKLIEPNKLFKQLTGELPSDKILAFDIK